MTTCASVILTLFIYPKHGRPRSGPTPDALGAPGARRESCGRRPARPPPRIRNFKKKKKKAGSAVGSGRSVCREARARAVGPSIDGASRGSRGPRAARARPPRNESGGVRSFVRSNRETRKRRLPRWLQAVAGARRCVAARDFRFRFGCPFGCVRAIRLGGGAAAAARARFCFVRFFFRGGVFGARARGPAAGPPPPMRPRRAGGGRAEGGGGRRAEAGEELQAGAWARRRRHTARGRFRACSPPEGARAAARAPRRPQPHRRTGRWPRGAHRPNPPSPHPCPAYLPPPPLSPPLRFIPCPRRAR